MDNAFNPLGNTVAITAASTAPTGVQAGASSTAKAAFAGQYRIVNAGNVTVHLGVGESAAAAQSAAAAATSRVHRPRASRWCQVRSRSSASTSTPTSAARPPRTRRSTSRRATASESVRRHALSR